MTVELNNFQFTLLPERALYKQDEQLLIIADIHLGKAAHFRKEGISITANAQEGDFINLENLLKKVSPMKVYFLGDLFHSKLNNDWLRFCDLVRAFPAVEFTLVKGNHDIIDHKKFAEVCISVTDSIEDKAFVYSHQTIDNIPKEKINITGHIHPGIVLKGKARQTVKMPCFYITRELVIVPAFGILTGLYIMEKSEGTRIYGVLPGEVIRVF